MHLCLVTSSYPTSPSDTALPFLPGFVAALEARGARVTVLAPDRRTSGCRPSGGRVVWFDWLGGPRPVASLATSGLGGAAIALHLIASGYASARLLHIRDPVDHTLAVFALPSGLVARLLEITSGAPYSVWALGSDVHTLGRRWPTRPVVAAVLRRARSRFANSRSLVRDVEALSGRGGAFLPCVRDLPSPAAVPVAAGRRNLLFLGRLEPVKGVDTLLSAFGRAARSRPELTLQVVGDGSMAAAVRAAAASPELAGRVRFQAAAGPSEVAGYLASCDALVLASRRESLPGVLVEAGRAGLPVIATAVGDVPEVVRRYGLGSLVPPDDPGALADALLAWAERPPERLPPETRARLASAFGADAAAATFLAALGSHVRPDR